jgi:hypothetical protein
VQMLAMYRRTVVWRCVLLKLCEKFSRNRASRIETFIPINTKRRANESTSPLLYLMHEAQPEHNICIV